mmetsp:Transcript_11555/g.35321  ORF Transcript_11555/g.35321 Transcript_11555/m.35321 type:complete len:273 (+) Transcript_11555:36-854(+)
MLGHIIEEDRAFRWPRTVEHWVKLVLIRHIVLEGSTVCMLTSTEVEKEEVMKLFEEVPNVRVEVVRWNTLESPSREPVHAAGAFVAICCFSELEKVLVNDQELDKLLTFISHSLCPGGYFFGTITDSVSIWTYAQKEVERREVQKRRGQVSSDDIYIREPLFNLYFPDRDLFKPLGTTYVVQYKSKIKDFDQRREYLVHFPTLLDAAKKHGLRMVEMSNFQDFWDEHRKLSHDLLKKAIRKEFVDEAFAGSMNADEFGVLALLSTLVFIMAG